MTLLIGMYYDNQKGALIASDSRAIMGDLILNSKKINYINDIIIAGSGAVHLWKEINNKLKSKLKNKNSKKIREIIKKETTRVLEYNKKQNFLSPDDGCEGIFGFYINNPEMFRLSYDIIDIIEDFAAVGSGEEIGYKILKDYYKQNLSKKHAIELAVYCMMKTSEDKANVDDNPQIALIDEQRCRILNEDKNGNFNFYKFSGMKKKMQRLDEQQRKVFDILWKDDNETKSKLIKILDEYKN